MMNEFLRDEFYVRRFGSKEAVNLGSSELRRFITNQMQEKVDGTHDRRFILLSAHDTLLTMLLTALGLR